uniref:Uncharacterized protein n=1 Tax=Grammatophora oceanica TaxID=210454 RepID=A0A7S1V0W6_9STRA|mmetsp:Transcript_32757/g.48523  ORF Transcript_32757/g.48523 Transcript_32757/m.48523 type:complete len:128 (+) Transcript_32757:405-788(+)|eukprot:CAMPEP_0194068782 /NCGR_PEP_ID=MMETSP0009_2-20130614/87284_1 /TAXON_ID=210454 /ORGANISM="Grammatophora oceanica, Strain CCMP 410" /LENGTH=127 /DNA_ID=CAMNT_0038721915 /DNA_START=394 /DNA_END=777 /DNA_ORIENTATION=-
MTTIWKKLVYLLVEEVDDGFDETMGGQSQVMHDTFNQADVSDEEDEGGDSLPLEDNHSPGPIMLIRMLPIDVQVWDAKPPALSSPVRSKPSSLPRKVSKKGARWIASTRSSPFDSSLKKRFACFQYE